MTFETTVKFLIVFVRLILGKKKVGVFTGPHGGKVTSDINFILSPYCRPLTADRDFSFESFLNSRLLCAMT